ncbi:MAG: hypothetical protein ABWY06_05240 [Pseudomonas sp.]|uniref:hypothetical protein n=1 Tax=Pseudomonas sp. TaxID=306 RepID=UPI0033949347
MDIKTRKYVLIAKVRNYIRTTAHIPSDPNKAADALFFALLQDWERLSEQSQNKLIEAMAILCCGHEAQERAQAETLRILRGLMRGG